MSKKRLCIATDTNCCFSKEEIEANELKVLSMEFLIDGKIYKEGIDLTHEEFYRFLENDVNVSTSIYPLFFKKTIDLFIVLTEKNGKYFF